MRVLFTAHGAHSHVLPLMGVAGALVAEGHEVLVATGAELCPLVASLGLAAVPVGMNDEDAVAAARRAWPEATRLPPAHWTVRMFARIAAPAMRADLAPVVERWRPDLLVREEGEHGGPIAAAAAGLPWVTHGWGSPLPPPETVADLRALLAPSWEEAGLPAPSAPGLAGAAVLDPCPPSLYLAPSDVASRHVVRPWGSGSGSGERAPAQAVARSGRRRAYVGFGTVPLFRDPADLLEVVVRALVDLDFDVTASVATEATGERLRDVDGDRVRVARWVDLPAVMATCDLAVCHGGAGTVLAALAAGVPLLIVPRGAPSQRRTSAACVARGLARAVDWDGTNSLAVVAALGDLATDGRAREAAAAVAAEMAAMPDPSTAVGVLRRVAAGRG